MISQIGNDVKARDWLAALDADPVIGSLVDVTSAFELESEELMQKAGLDVGSLLSLPNSPRCPARRDDADHAPPHPSTLAPRPDRPDSSRPKPGSPNFSSARSSAPLPLLHLTCPWTPLLTPSLVRLIPRTHRTTRRTSAGAESVPCRPDEPSKGRVL